MATVSAPASGRGFRRLPRLVPGMLRTPLPYLSGLLAAYLLLPIGAFLVRLSGASASALRTPGLGAALRTSLITATVATVVIAVLGIPLGYLLADVRGRLAAVLGVLVQLPLALPPLMSGILLIYVVGPYTTVGEFFRGELTDHAAGIVLAQIFVAAPFLIVAARSAFAAVDSGLADVAATLGHGRLARFLRVALPCAAPGIGAGLLLAWLRAFGEFGATVILAYHPYSLPVLTYVQFGMTGLTSTMLPVASALLAAFVVLGLAVWLPGLAVPRRAITPPEPRPPTLATPLSLAFDITARLGGFRLDASHHARGARLAILGSSGAGKSLTLRVLAGLVTPESGRVMLGSSDITALPAEKRGVGYLPQDECLLPHLPVWQQVTFGDAADPGLAAYWLDKLGLSGLEHRRPDQLSGGQRRRVGLARALATAPRLLLLDEPFTGLDTPVRDELRRLLRRLQRETGLCTVLVTHDPDEAALLADEVMVLVDGRVVQAGEQRAVFAHPVSVTAARLLGARNLLAGRMLTPTLLDAGGFTVELTPRHTSPRLGAGAAVTWSVPPRDVRIESRDAVGIPGTVVDVVHLGPLTEVTVRLPDGLELAALTTDDAPSEGTPLRITLPPSAVRLWQETDNLTRSQAVGAEPGVGASGHEEVDSDFSNQ